MKGHGKNEDNSLTSKNGPGKFIATKVGSVVKATHTHILLFARDGRSGLDLRPRREWQLIAIFDKFSSIRVNTLSNHEFHPPLI